MTTKLDITKYVAQYGMRPYWLSVLIAFDQFVNAIFWGYPDETISSRSFRCRKKARWRIAEKIIDGIFYWDKMTLIDGRVIRHCEMSYYGELALEHLPSEYRE